MAMLFKVLFIFLLMNSSTLYSMKYSLYNTESNDYEKDEKNNFIATLKIFKGFGTQYRLRVENKEYFAKVTHVDSKITRASGNRSQTTETPSENNTTANVEKCLKLFREGLESEDTHKTEEIIATRSNQPALTWKKIYYTAEIINYTPKQIVLGRMDENFVAYLFMTIEMHPIEIPTGRKTFPADKIKPSRISYSLTEKKLDLSSLRDLKLKSSVQGQRKNTL